MAPSIRIATKRHAPGQRVERAAPPRWLKPTQTLRPTIDPDGLTELVGCTLSVMHSHAA